MNFHLVNVVSFLLVVALLVALVGQTNASPCTNVVPASCPVCRQQTQVIEDVCKYVNIYTGQLNKATHKFELERDIKSLKDIQTAELEWAMGNCNCYWMDESQGVIMMTKSEVDKDQCLRLDSNVIIVPAYQLNMFDLKKQLKTNGCVL